MYHVFVDFEPERAQVRISIACQDGNIPQLDCISIMCLEKREVMNLLSNVFSGVWYSSSRFCCRMLTRSIVDDSFSC